MKRTSLGGHPCSIARTLDIAGEWWTPLILRDVAYGLRRFGELQEDLGISANVLSDRLESLVREGLLETRVYQQRPERMEYVLTEKGQELVPALVALMQWGDRWGWDGGRAPVRVLHERCGEPVTVELRCSHCERDVSVDELLATPGDPVPDPPAEQEPGYLSGRRMYSAPDGIPIGRSG
jgi:DNA-binding HxlR family transcriptional regulator